MENVAAVPNAGANIRNFYACLLEEFTRGSVFERLAGINAPSGQIPKAPARRTES